MKINYNVTGPKRKALVGALSLELNAPTVYLGAPTFAYEVGGYHIDKNGMLEGEDNYGLVADLKGLHDFKAITEEYDTKSSEAKPVPEDIQIPYEAALGGRVSPYCDYEEPPAYKESEQSDEVETNRLTIEMPLDGFTDEKLDNLFKLVKAKETLLKEALKVTELNIEQTETTLCFPWFNVDFTGDKAMVYTTFISKLFETAKNKTRVTAKDKTYGNPKYAMRCFLLSLGMIGDEYKKARKILLSNLKGSSAFKAGAKNE